MIGLMVDVLHPISAYVSILGFSYMTYIHELVVLLVSARMEYYEHNEQLYLLHSWFFY